MAYGTVNADVIQSSVSGVSLGAGNASNFKNRIINGAMVIDQRNAGASVTASTTGTYVYTLDRWRYYATAASKYTVQQNAGSVTPPTGFTNYLGVTSSSAYSVGSGDTFFISQIIEGYNIADLGWGSANAQTITVSFWVRSSLTGTFGGSLRNADTPNRSYPFSYTISSANTWEQKSITIAGDTSGTWNTTNGQGIQVQLNLGSGSTFSGTANSWQSGNLIAPTGATSVVGTNGATFYITGVQFEVGSSATGFEYRDYGRELFMCQRYYQKSFPIGSPPGQSGIYGSTVSMMASGNGYIWANHLYRVPMRTTPSLAFYTANGGASGYVRYTQSGANQAVSSIDHYTESGFAGFAVPTATFGYVYDWNYTASAEL